jgi:hypothetical protein
LSKIDPCGNSTCSDMASGNSHTTQYIYTDNYASGGPGSSVNTNTYLYKIIDPVGHTTSYQYNYGNGLLVSSTDENLQPTSYTYADPLNRLTEVQGPPDPNNGNQSATIGYA